MCSRCARPRRGRRARPCAAARRARAAKSRRRDAMQDADEVHHRVHVVEGARAGRRRRAASATTISTVGSTSRSARARLAARHDAHAHAARAQACSATARPTKPLPPRMQTLRMSMAPRECWRRCAGSAAAPPGTVPSSSRIGSALAGEAVAVEPRVGEDLLHVVARLVEGDGLGVDRAFERALVAPAARAPGPGVVRGGGEDRMAEVGQHAAEVVRAHLDVDLGPHQHLLAEGRIGIWRATQRAVAGMSCMSPVAPTRERASGMKRLSWRIDADTRSPRRGPIAARARASASRCGVG